MEVRELVVYLVGAGPGDPDLITVRAEHLLKRADAVVYDRLVHPNVIRLVGSSCKKYYVGKKAGNHYKTQSEINQLLLRLGRNHAVVVRLKGGDPFLFGRGGEEAEVLFDARIPFEIVPGISSLYAVPAYAGIPLTHRDFNSGFAVFTGHRVASSKAETDITKLPPVVVFLMGVGNRGALATRLMQTEGFDSSTPTAAITWGTYLKQRVTVTTLGELERADIKIPAIIVVGHNVGLRNKLNWFEAKLRNLQGKRVLIPRPEEDSKELLDTLTNLGADVRFTPLMELRELPFEEPNPDNYDIYVFTSKNGIRVFTSKHTLDPSKKYYVIGPSTQSELKEKGISSACPDQYNSIALGEFMLDTLPPDSRIILIRSANASSDLRYMLSSSHKVSQLHVYEVVPVEIEPEAVRKVDIIWVTAGTVARALVPQVDEIRRRGITLVSIGPMTSRIMKELGISPDVEASEHTLQGMVSALLDYLMFKRFEEQ